MGRGDRRSNTVALLGLGMQGRAALHDLVAAPEVAHIWVADVDSEALHAHLASLDTSRVQGVVLDSSDFQALVALLERAQVAVELLPARFHETVARAAIAAGTHLVNASHASPGLRSLGPAAQAADVAILPESGLDPGLDLVLARLAVQELDTVEAFYSYGAGIPEPRAADNPLKYKISWTFRGVLSAYTRDARVIREGRPVTIPGTALFAPEHVHTLTVEGLGTLEAYPNGDVVHYLESLGLTGVREAARYTARWPGHAAFWRPLVALGFLADDPVQVGEATVRPRDFLEALLAPQLQYGPQERDVAFLRVEARGLRAGRPHRVIYELVDFRDLHTGLLAMQRTVGFTASIVARMLLEGQIRARGVLSPARDIPPEHLLAELGRRGIQIRRREGTDGESRAGGLPGQDG